MKNANQFAADLRDIAAHKETLAFHVGWLRVRGTPIDLEYSCNCVESLAALNNLNKEKARAEYEHLFSPTSPPHRACWLEDDLFTDFEQNQWRITALRFLAAMVEAGDFSSEES